MFHERRLLILWFFDRSKIGIFGLLTTTSSHLVVLLAGLRGLHTLCLCKAIFAVSPPLTLKGCARLKLHCVFQELYCEFPLGFRHRQVGERQSCVSVAGLRVRGAGRSGAAVGAGGGGAGRALAGLPRAPGSLPRARGFVRPGRLISMRAGRAGLCWLTSCSCCSRQCPAGRAGRAARPPLRSNSLSAGDAHVAPQRRPASHGIWCLDSYKMQNYSAANAQ